MRLEEVPPVLTVTEAMEILRLGKHSVRALIADGRLPALRVGRALRIPRRGVLELLGEDGQAPSAGAEGQKGAEHPERST